MEGLLVVYFLGIPGLDNWDYIILQILLIYTPHQLIAL